ncbi:hypothetical protein IB265_33005 [Ensifer sp. ENS10]|uniref:hypothetical protein n=1 Tax=Ensifer sp. ENS10 TaxID=2769286 RepID=UPI0017823F06|nr:hypothetical protein [Ensifer sp. ENS10]MBD9511577.1 hypothetical protein [Ensifer sp. ENS10]
MKNRVKIGDVEIGVMKNPDPSKNTWIVYRYRPRTNEYLSKDEERNAERAQYLFTQVVGREETRQRRAAELSAAAIDEMAQAAFAVPEPVESAPHYQDHPYYARF